MTHSYRLHYFHLIWSTRQRLPHIAPDVQSRLYPYLGATTRNHSGKLLEIGGMSDHVHLLIELSLLDKFSYFIRDLKASSSQWILQNQEQHHATMSFEEEYLKFLKHHHVKYDERFVLG